MGINLWIWSIYHIHPYTVLPQFCTNQYGWVQPFEPFSPHQNVKHSYE